MFKSKRIPRASIDELDAAGNKKQREYPPVDFTSSSTRLINDDVESVGLLSIPYAISITGILLGPPLLLIVALLCLYCMLLLLRTSSHLCFKYDLPSLGYGDVLELAFQDYLGNENKIGRRLADAFLILTQLGFCSIYFIMISENVQRVIENNISWFHLPLKVYITVLLVFIMLLSFVWNIKTLAVFSMAGNVFIFTGLIAIAVYMFQNPNYHNIQDTFIGDVAKLPIFFAMAVYAFEGIGLILPLENQMKYPSHFPFILTLSILCVLAIQLFFSVLGFICFRDEIQGSISFNLPEGVISAVAQLAIAFTVYLTYPLMFFVPMEIIVPWAKEKFNRFTPYTVEFWLRTFFVILTFLFSVLIPHIELFIALIGALASSSLALIFPPVAYLMVFRDSISRGKKVTCWIIAIFGIIMCIVGTVYSVMDIVKALI